MRGITSQEVSPGFLIRHALGIVNFNQHWLMMQQSQSDIIIESPYPCLVVGVRLEESTYPVREVDGSVEICIVTNTSVLDRTVTITISTEAGDDLPAAEGKWVKVIW